MNEYYVIFEGGLKVKVEAGNVILAAAAASGLTSRDTNDILEVSKNMHYFGVKKK